VDDVWSKFANVADNPLDHLARWKKTTGRNIIGCHPMHCPEEIIHAAGALPITMLGSGGPITLANKHLQSTFICMPVRYNLDSALGGRLDFLDGMIFPDICEETRCLSDIWKANCSADFHYSLLLPVNLTLSTAKEFLASELANLRASLEKFTGREISDDDLRRSISVYNYNRQLLSWLYEIRRTDPGLFRTRDVAAVVASSMLMPKEEHSELLSSLLAQIEGARHPSEGRPRLVLSGGLCDMPELDVLDLVEELGAVAVDDDLYVGSRYFATQADETLDPIEALASKFIEDIPCPTKYDPSKDWGDYLVNLVRRSQASGVVIFMAKFCEPHGFDYPHLKDKLSDAEIPHLLLQTDHSGPSGQIRTRLQAFVELIGRG
jgi:benzoyl-CoA reductase subunit C